MPYKFNAYQTYRRCRDFFTCRIRRVIAVGTRKFQERQLRRKNESSQDRAARRTATATVWIAAFTVVTAGVAIKTYYAIDGQLQVFRDQLAEMKSSGEDAKKLIDANVKLATASQKSADTADKNLIATQRAWVGAIDAALIAADLGTVIKGTVSYINSGKEPAKILAETAVNLYSKEEWYNNIIPPLVITNQQNCLGKAGIEGFRFAWPTTGFSNYFIHFQDGTAPQKNVIPWSEKIKGGQDIVAIQGCITYEAFQKIHHTAFCYFYDARTSDINHLNICGGGNYVD